MREQLLAVVEIGLALLEVDREFDRVEDPDLVAALLGGLAQAPRAVALRVT